MAALYSPPYPEARPAETLPTPEVQPAVYLAIPEAAQRVYDRGTIADTLQRMFSEADQMPGAFMEREDAYALDMHPHDPDVYQKVMREIQVQAANSPAVKKLQNTVEHNGQVISIEDKKEIAASEVEAVFRAYEQAFRRTVAKLKEAMTSKQMNVLKFNAQSELNYSFRDVITRHLMLGSEQEMKFDPLDFFLLANPKVRKIDYMTNPEILATLKHSMTISSMRTDRLRNDVRAVESRSHRSDYQDLIASDQVRKVQLEIQPKNT